MISPETYNWMVRHLTAEDLDQWGTTTVRAVASLIDGLTTSDKEHHP